MKTSVSASKFIGQNSVDVGESFIDEIVGAVDFRADAQPDQPAHAGKKRIEEAENEYGDAHHEPDKETKFARPMSFKELGDEGFQIVPHWITALDDALTTLDNGVGDILDGHLDGNRRNLERGKNGVIDGVDGIFADSRRGEALPEDD